MTEYECTTLFNEAKPPIIAMPIELTPTEFLGQLGSESFKKWVSMLYEFEFLDVDDAERTVKAYIVSYFRRRNLY